MDERNSLLSSKRRPPRLSRDVRRLASDDECVKLFEAWYDRYRPTPRDVVDVSLVVPPTPSLAELIARFDRGQGSCGNWLDDERLAAFIVFVNLVTVRPRGSPAGERRSSFDFPPTGRADGTSLRRDAESVSSDREASDTRDLTLSRAMAEIRKICESMLWSDAGRSFSQSALLLPSAYAYLQDAKIEGCTGADYYLTLTEILRRVLVEYSHSLASDSQSAADAYRLLISRPFGEGIVSVLRTDMAFAVLSSKSQVTSDIAQLRYFFNLSDRRIASFLSLTEADVTLRLRLARSWLLANLPPYRESLNRKPHVRNPFETNID